MPFLTTDPIWLGLVALLSYALGAVPFGVVVTRALGLGDVRAVGSGNIGATNVLRMGHRGAALATLVLDGAKGAVAVLMAQVVFGQDAAQVAALAALLGHIFPIWLGFRGGKGVATFFGALLALSWPVGLISAALWAAIFAVTRISSLSALFASGMAGFIAFMLGELQLLVLLFVMMVLIYTRHSDNIARMREGTEPKFGRK
jgi:acyl phosphate:glycerol-3-phosphate acyltransferase